MQQDSYVEIISDLTNRALWEVKNVIDCIPDCMWDKEYCGMPVWKHVYHMLHSLDQWYIDPNHYEEPFFHTPELNNLDAMTSDTLSREQIQLYFETIQNKIQAYNTGFQDKDLISIPQNCKWTNFTLILSQYRHLHSHMGMIMGFIIAETGKWPKVLGLKGDIPTGNYEKYYE